MWSYGSRNFKTQVDKDGRVCTFCKVYKPWSDFFKSAKNKTGHDQTCRSCKNKKRSPIRNSKKELSQAKLLKQKLKKADPFEYKSRNIRSSLLNRERKHNKDLETPSKRDIKNWLKAHELKCHYSGESLDLLKCQVDHKLPVSRGGTNNINNLCLCTPVMNSSKGTMTESEFNQLLKLIVSWEDKGIELLRRLRQAYYR